MATVKHYSFLVLFRPHGQAVTVDQIKVIDAWDSTNKSLLAARNLAEAKQDEYKAKHGEGRIEVIQSVPSSHFWL